MFMNKNDVKIMAKRYNFVIETYKPDKIKLYGVFYGDKKLTYWMPFKALCAWLEGYETGQETRQEQSK